MKVNFHDPIGDRKDRYITMNDIYHSKKKPHMKALYIIKSILFFFLLNVVLIGIVSTGIAEEATFPPDSLSRIDEGEETILFGQLICETEELQFFLMDATNLAEQTEIRIKVAPTKQTVFPYPIGAILPPLRTGPEAYLSATIGKNISFTGFSPTEKGLTMAQYLDMKEKEPIWFDLLLIDQGEPYFSYNKIEWTVQDDGSVLAKCVMQPPCNEELLTVRCYYGSFDADSLKTHFGNGGNHRPPDQKKMMNILVNNSSRDSFPE